MTSMRDSVLDAWRINGRATIFLVERIPDEVWTATLPAAPRRSMRSIAAHLHNARCVWMKSLATGAKIRVPGRVKPTAATRDGVVASLQVSGSRILSLLEAGLDNDGEFPGVSNRFIYGAMPRNATLFCGYALAHEAHHRSQILFMARELGHRFPPAVANGLWQWSSRLRECRAG